MTTLVSELVPQAKPLREFLQAQPFCVPLDRLVQEQGLEEEEDFLQFLKDTVVAPSPEASSFWSSQEGPLYKEGTNKFSEGMYMIAMRSIDQLVGSKSGNILAKGFRRIAEGKSSGSQLFPFLQSVQNNEMVLQLLQKPWEVLLNRLGDGLMVLLLTKSLIFTKLPNRCFLQIAGVPVSKYRQENRSSIYVPLSSETENFQNDGQDACEDNQIGGGLQIEKKRPSQNKSNHNIKSLNNICLNRMSLFYGQFHNHGRINVGLPPNHILCQSNPSRNGAKKVVATVLSP